MDYSVKNTCENRQCNSEKTDLRSNSESNSE